MSQRFRRLTDLFVRGKTVELPDGTYLWVRVINSYERDECVSDAQVARSRMVLALKNDGNERLKVEARFAEKGRPFIEAEIVAAKVDEKYPDIVSALEDDPAWTERVQILRRTDFTQAVKPAEEAERAVVDKIFEEWTGAIQDRLSDEKDWLISHYRRASDEALLADYLEMWLERRGSDLATAEYSLTETWYATRYCEGAKDDSDEVDHARCNGHPQQVFETKADARSSPDELQRLVRAALMDLAMEGRDPKGSASAESSSASSPTPSAPEASTPSTSTETPNAPPGPSPQPSVTP